MKAFLHASTYIVSQIIAFVYILLLTCIRQYILSFCIAQMQ